MQKEAIMLPAVLAFLGTEGRHLFRNTNKEITNVLSHKVTGTADEING